jgi:CPA2 family monovalent cation:H+ antiporter-2
LSEAVLVENGVAMGPVIASIHELRDIYRKQIQEEGDLDQEPKLKSFSTSVGQATADDLVPDGLSPQEQP